MGEWKAGRGVEGEREHEGSDLRDRTREEVSEARRDGNRTETYRGDDQESTEPIDSLEKLPWSLGVDGSWDVNLPQDERERNEERKDLHPEGPPTKEE